VKTTPYYWVGGTTPRFWWATDLLDRDHYSFYPEGTYTVSAESTLNNMKANYRMYGADYTGKTVSQAYTITLVTDRVKIEANKMAVTRGNTFSVTVSGRPSGVYYLWVKDTGALTGGANNQAPMVILNQEKLMLDPPTGPFFIGSYQYDGGGAQTIKMNVGTDPVYNGTRYYGQIITTISGTRTIEFQTNSQTRNMTFTIRVENKSHGRFRSDEVNITVEKGKPVSVMVPNGDENWEQGTAHTITWKYTVSPGSYVRIELLRGTAVNRVITSNISVGSGGSGSKSWTVPYNQALGSDYKIRINSTSNAAATDTSDTAFTISAGAPITVTNPNGGQNWTRGSAHTIMWRYTGSPGSKVKIELLKGTMVNRVINASTSVGLGGSGSYSWNIASNQNPGTDYKIRINSTSNAAVTDTSNANFAIIG
jgi:hypothetical protein